MKLLSLDVGTTESGYAILEVPEYNKLTIHEFGKIDNNKLLEIQKEKKSHV